MNAVRSTPLKALGTIDPITLADLVLTLPLREAVSLVTIEPETDRSLLVLEQGGHPIDAFGIAPEVATAACARLALAAKLDLLAKAGTPEGASNVARLLVRSGADVGELLVSIVARGEGLEAEIRTLSVNGRVPAVSRTVQLRRCARCAAFLPARASVCERDGAALVDVEDRPEPGGTIGQYLVGAALGEGGDGVVFRGQHAVIGKPVAIKLLHRSYAGNVAAARRFLAEARAASRLHDDHVIEVNDYGLLANGQPYIVMEWVKGVTLGHRMHAGPALDPSFTLRIAKGIARALAAAHAAGIVHNDLKPSNVMLLEGSSEDAPRLKVLDFGAASQLGHTQDPERMEIFGTPIYMSPELGQGHPTDGRSDLYALGVLIYEMLAGTVPFDGGNPAEIIRKHAYAVPPPIQAERSALPPQVTRLVMRCLRKSPHERPQTAEELIAEIDEALVALARPAWKRWLT